MLKVILIQLVLHLFLRMWTFQYCSPIDSRPFLEVIVVHILLCIIYSLHASDPIEPCFILLHLPVCLPGELRSICLFGVQIETHINLFDVHSVSTCACAATSIALGISL